MQDCGILEITSLLKQRMPSISRSAPVDCNSLFWIGGHFTSQCPIFIIRIKPVSRIGYSGNGILVIRSADLQRTFAMGIEVNLLIIAAVNEANTLIALSRNSVFGHSNISGTILNLDTPMSAIDSIARNRQVVLDSEYLNADLIGIYGSIGDIVVGNGNIRNIAQITGLILANPHSSRQRIGNFKHIAIDGDVPIQFHLRGSIVVAIDINQATAAIKILNAFFLGFLNKCIVLDDHIFISAEANTAESHIIEGVIADSDIMASLRRSHLAMGANGH